MSLNFNYLVWDQWSQWGNCDATCGGGTTFRSRNCLNGQVGEVGCDIGEASETRVCENQFCPGQWDCNEYKIYLNPIPIL